MFRIRGKVVHLKIIKEIKKKNCYFIQKLIKLYFFKRGIKRECKIMKRFATEYLSDITTHALSLTN